MTVSYGPARIGAKGPATYPTIFRNRRGVTSASPITGLPGSLAARQMVSGRSQMAGTPTPPPILRPEIKCAADYVSITLRDMIVQALMNLQLAARRPSHIDVPLTGLCFDRHVGTGGAATSDPPVALPPAPGGAFTLVADFTVPRFFRGVIKEWGVDVVQGPPVAELIEWRIVINGQQVLPFDRNFGAVPAAALGVYVNPPFTFTSPGHLCINLKSDDVIQLQARNNTALPGNALVAAFFSGWIYLPTIDEPGALIRSTMTDQY